MVTVITAAKRRIVYKNGVLKSTNDKGQLTLLDVDKRVIAGFAPGEWVRFSTGDEEDHDMSGPLVG